MQMSREELKQLQAGEGIVLGSVKIKGGKDLLGRTQWKLAAKRIDNSGPEYSMQAHREGDEEFWAVRMAAGSYRIYKLYQEGFSTFLGLTDIQFTVDPGKTKYLGRLVIEFPPGLLAAATRFTVAIEDGKDGALEKSAMKAGLTVSDVATDLMKSQDRTGCLTTKVTLGSAPTSTSVRLPCF